MKKKLLSVLLAGAMVLSLAACGSKEAAPADTSSDTAAATTEASDSADTSDAASDSADASDPTGGQLVDGKFAETRTIVVEVYDQYSKKEIIRFVSRVVKISLSLLKKPAESFA